jgi:hypothetical protein
MEYNIDNSLLWNNVFMFTTDSGVKYVVKFDEFSSDTWTLDFYIKSGEPVRSEIFKTISTLGYGASIFLNERGINNLMVYITGSDRNEIDQKTNVFTRWIKSPFSYEIIKNPIIRVEGSKSVLTTNTNFIKISRSEVSELQVNSVNVSEPINEVFNQTSVVSKFCHNCGLENNNYKFCPGCGTNLQQT